MSKRTPEWAVMAPGTTEAGRTFWTRCGVGFTNPDKGKGESISLRLHVQSAEGKYVLFPPDPSEKGADAVQGVARTAK